MLTPAEQTSRQLDWFTNLGVRQFDLAVQTQTGAWLAPHQGLERDALEKLLPWCRAENARGSNVYVRPHRRDAIPVVFLDDVAVAAAIELSVKHHALVVETSSDRCHVWLATDRLLDERGRYQVQSALARRDFDGSPLADPGSVSGDHYGRLAGFRNRKPTRDCWVNLRLATSNGAPLRTASLALPPVHPISTPRGHVEAATAGKRSASSASERDWAQVLCRLERGDDPSIVERDLTSSAAARRGPDAQRYAARTVSQALAYLRS